MAHLTLLYSHGQNSRDATQRVFMLHLWHTMSKPNAVYCGQSVLYETLEVYIQNLLIDIENVGAQISEQLQNWWYYWEQRTFSTDIYVGTSLRHESYIIIVIA